MTYRCAFLLAFGGASTLPAAEATAQDRDSAGVRIVESATPAWRAANGLRLEPTPMLVLGRPGAAAEQQFGKVAGAIRLRDGSVVVADGQALTLRRFDSMGVFLRAIGQRGEGPGDLRWIDWIKAIGGDSILVWDPTLQRLTAFNSQGRLLTTVIPERLPPVTDPRDGARFAIGVSIIGRFADGAFLTTRRLPLGMSQETGFHADTLILGHLAGRGPPTEVGRLLYREAFVYNFPGGSISGWRPFSRNGAVTTDGHHVHTSDGRAFEVRTFTTSGALVRIFRIRRAPTLVTAGEIARDKASRLTSESSRFRAELERINAWLPFPRTKPAFDALHADAQGRLWARVAGDSMQAAKWEVFAPTGVWLGTVTTPAGLAVLEIGRDYLLGRTKDEDGVDIVQLFRMIGG